MKDIKKELDIEIECIVIEDDDEVQITEQTPLHPRKRLKKLKNVKKELDDEIEILGQTPLHPRKRLQRTDKMKKSKKELDDEI